jgi:hypothetical protein
MNINFAIEELIKQFDTRLAYCKELGLDWENDHIACLLVKERWDKEAERDRMAL